MIDWQPLDTAPLNQNVLLWWVGGRKLPKAPPTCTIGQVSSYEPGRVWNGFDYVPEEWFTHWAPMPDGPPDVVNITQANSADAVDGQSPLNEKGPDA